MSFVRICSRPKCKWLCEEGVLLVKLSAVLKTCAKFFWQKVWMLQVELVAGGAWVTIHQGQAVLNLLPLATLSTQNFKMTHLLKLSNVD